MTTMTAEEKKLIQAQHRLEEAQMRAKEKARKARTRRLIQEGAVLEKVLPEVQTVGLSELEGYLNGKMSGNEENGSCAAVIVCADGRTQPRVCLCGRLL